MQALRFVYLVACLGALALVSFRLIKGKPWRLGSFAPTSPLPVAGLVLVCYILGLLVLGALSTGYVFSLFGLAAGVLILRRSGEGLAPIFQHGSSSAMWRTGLLLGLAVALPADFVARIGQFLADLAGLPPEKGLLAEALRTSRNPVTIIYAVTLVCVLAPAAEELTFRGILLRSLLRWWRPGWAIGVSAFVFALAHHSWQSFLAQLLVGLVTGIAYQRTSSLPLVVGLHMVRNSLVVALILAERVLGG